MTDSRVVHSRDEFAEVFPDYYSPTEQIRIGRLVEEDRQWFGDAFQARAGRAPHRANLRCLDHAATIAIAATYAVCTVYAISLWVVR